MILRRRGWKISGIYLEHNAQRLHDLNNLQSCAHQKPRTSESRTMHMNHKMNAVQKSKDAIVTRVTKRSLTGALYTVSVTAAIICCGDRHCHQFSVVRYKLFSVTLRAILRADHWKYRYQVSDSRTMRIFV